MRSCLALVEWFIHPFASSIHSRLKKIKCVQIKSQLCCEACEAGNIPCQFRDRERYFAERSRIVTGASAGSSPAHSRCSSQSTEPSTIPPPTRGDSVDASGWYSGAQTSSDHGHPSRYASSSPSYSLSSSPQSNPGQWFSSPLVEPARLHYERSARRTPDSYDAQMSDPVNYFMFRQPSYTSPVPQLGNGTYRTCEGLTSEAKGAALHDAVYTFTRHDMWPDTPPSPHSRWPAQSTGVCGTFSVHPLPRPFVSLFLCSLR